MLVNGCADVRGCSLSVQSPGKILKNNPKSASHQAVPCLAPLLEIISRRCMLLKTFITVERKCLKM